MAFRDMILNCIPVSDNALYFVFVFSYIFSYICLCLSMILVSGRSSSNAHPTSSSSSLSKPPSPSSPHEIPLTAPKQPSSCRHCHSTRIPPAAPPRPRPPASATAPLPPAPPATSPGCSLQGGQVSPPAPPALAPAGIPCPPRARLPPPLILLFLHTSVHPLLSGAIF